MIEVGKHQNGEVEVFKALKRRQHTSSYVTKRLAALCTPEVSQSNTAGMIVNDDGIEKNLDDAEVVGARVIEQDSKHQDATDQTGTEIVSAAAATDKEEEVEDVVDIKVCPPKAVEWMQKRKAAIESGVAPEWLEGDACMLCDDEFSFFFRKHHCRQCGALVCSKCGSQSAVLPFSGGKSVRVCVPCRVFDNERVK
jgi:FYVE zinc finger